MPPPRLSRPLRPYHSRWSLPQIRWASDGPRGRLQAHHGDPGQTSHAAGEAYGRGLEKKSTKQAKQAAQPGWLGSIFGRLSGLFNQQPPPAPDEQPVPPRVRSTNYEGAAWKGCGLEQAESHPGKQEAERAGPSGVHEEPSTISQAGRQDGPTPTAGRTRSCSVCRKTFPSAARLKHHLLCSDRCREADLSKHYYMCRACNLRFLSTEDARHHFNFSPGCIPRMGVLGVPEDGDFALPSQLQRIREAIRAAYIRDKKLALALNEVAESLDAMSSPKIRAIAGGIVEHLLRLKEGGQLHGKAQKVVRRKDISATPLPRSKKPSKRQTDANPTIRKHFPGKRSIDPIDMVPLFVDRGRRERSAALLATDSRSNSAAHEKDQVRWFRSLRDDAERQDQKPNAPEGLAHAVSDIAPTSNSDSNAGLVLQLQQLTEQMRLLTEKLAPSSSLAGMGLPQPTNTYTARSRPADKPSVVPRTCSSDHPQPPPASEALENLVTSSMPQSKEPSSDAFGREKPLSAEEGKKMIPESSQSVRRPSNKEPPEPSASESQPPLEKPHKRQLEHSYFRYYYALFDDAARHAPTSTRPTNVSRMLKPSENKSNSIAAPAKIKLSSSQRKEKSPIHKPESGTQDDAKEGVPVDSTKTYENRSDNQRLSRQIHTQATLTKSLSCSKGTSGDMCVLDSAEPANQAQPVAFSTSTAPPSGEMSEQSLLDELFPESSSYIQPHYSGRDTYPKLDLPSAVPVIKRHPYDRQKSGRETLVESFSRGREQITALQLLHCSTELVESDFRRLIPKGKHIEGWLRDGEFMKVIPGRDPLNLERLPFYYLLFKSPESALAYQKNAVRLHKLSQLHQPSSIMSPIPPPKGFLEEGEDINLATSSFLLKPTGLPLSLNMVMQPYNARLRALMEQGGYKPIVPSTGANGKPIYKVLMHIEGYEPSQMDLCQLLTQEGYGRGIQWPFHKGFSGIQRLRDVIDIRAKLLPVSSANPRAARSERHRSTEDDTSLGFLTLSGEGEKATQINQMVMNRVYNRWMIEFEDEEAARRFARLWNRRVLPISRNVHFASWRDTEERRMCNAEYLW
ncbi:hypothetical protein K458DRAFT_333298 [Lentithecium fluviatile CBS 122367]|uniref:Uncharacterized protein n=1 Tax=Lentithecium fluviatile CBS 122367 TaxID=1168545 RepID=A0A6G1JA91_9PLEO|nr:hypothetical protein K458DRAFT_333298 [Lentithecium fluviatile CBS 122367]